MHWAARRAARSMQKVRAVAGLENDRSVAGIARIMALGLVIAAMYVALFLLEDPILALSAHGRWYALLPVTIAFAFSLVHGAFTGHFWDLLGVKARK
jgi:hypothetical protein